MARLSSTLDRFPRSAINEVFALASRMREEGRDLVDLSIGELDFATPAHVVAAAKAAIDRGETRYTTLDGSSALKRAIRDKFARDNGLDFPPDGIVVGTGAKPLLLYALQAMVEPGDEVVTPAPCWTSYTGMIRLAGAQPVLARPSRQGSLAIAPEDLERAIGPRTRCVMLNSPCNPSGVVYGPAEMGALCEVLLAHPDVWVIADDLYEHLVFDGAEFATPAAIEPRLADRVLTLNGVSKSYAMTGWRIGFAGGPVPLVRAMAKIMSQSTGSPPAPSQAAAIAALDGPQDFLAGWRETLARRRDLALGILEGEPRLRTARPQGAFYLFPDCRALLGASADGARIESSADLARWLLERAGVALVPGEAFEAPGHLRLSTGVADEQVAEGCERIVAACRRL